MHDPRGPTGGGGGGGGPSRYPRFRPGGGGGGGLDDSSGGRGGMVFEDPYRFRPTMSSSSGYGPGASAAATGHATTHPSDFLPTSYGPGATGTTTTTPHQAHISPPLRRPNYDANDFAASAEPRQQNMMYSVPQRGGGGVDVGSYETTQEPSLYRSSNGGNGMYHAMNESGPFTSAATGAAAAGAAGAAGPSSNLKSAMKRNVGFEDATTGGPSMETEHLSRPRGEETARGETSAGALPDKRDGLGTL